MPVEFRRALGVERDTVYQVTLEGNALRLKPVEVRQRSQGSPWLRALYEYFALVREEMLAAGYSEVEVNADIEAAVRAVREDHAASAWRHDQRLR
jgi:hypothetical protein